MISYNDSLYTANDGKIHIEKPEEAEFTFADEDFRFKIETSRKKALYIPYVELVDA